MEKIEMTKLTEEDIEQHRDEIYTMPCRLAPPFLTTTIIKQMKQRFCKTFGEQDASDSKT